MIWFKQDNKQRMKWSTNPDPYMDFLRYRYVTHNLTEYNIFLVLYYYLLMVIKNKIINL